jgi:3-oxoacyl-(acyl-carrier-protein) synthase
LYESGGDKSLEHVRIAVTGIGAVSVQGPNAESLLDGLRQARRVFGPSKRHDVDFDIVVGEARETCFAEHSHAELDSPTGSLCLQAARECVEDAARRGAGPPSALLLGTSTGGQSQNERILFSILDGRPDESYSYRRQGCMAAPSRLVARDLDIQGPIQTISTACTSSANAIALGAAWVANGWMPRVLVGGGDALCYTTLSSFHILELTGPSPCRPFGPDRPGMTLADGAGFLMIESMDDVLESGRAPLAELLGYGMSSDAHHMTAPKEDGAGAELAIREALGSAGVRPEEVAFINAHGTGTRLNDAAEAAAIGRVFGQTPVMSCKGIVGHTLGGAGGIEAVATVLALLEHRAYENGGASVPGEDCPVTLIGAGGVALPDHAVAVSTSFAFGGNNCVLVFGAPREGEG